MNDPELQERLEKLKAKRRRERWQAFLIPLITLGSIVVSVGMVMYMLKSCSGRFPQMP
ncbi:MAG: hypothetical protein AABZ09_04270 [Candidatus Binatota bacterium]